MAFIRAVLEELGFRHGVLRHHAILVNQINKHIPLAPVTEQVAEQPVDCALISQSVGGFEDCLQEVIGLLSLSQNSKYLTKFKVLQVHPGHGAGSE